MLCSKLLHLCSLYGVKVVSPQPLLKALPKLFEAKQEPVRDGAKNLTVYCHHPSLVASDAFLTVNLHHFCHS